MCVCYCTLGYTLRNTKLPPPHSFSYGANWIRHWFSFPIKSEGEFEFFKELVDVSGLDASAVNGPEEVVQKLFNDTRFVNAKLEDLRTACDDVCVLFWVVLYIHLN